jgi:hypothetical protein
MLVLFFLISLFFARVPIVAAQSVQVPVQVEPIENDGVDMGPHFFGGETVTVDEDLVGDVYVAGGTVTVNGNIAGDLLVAGGEVTIAGTVTQDVRVAGGEVTLEGTIGGNTSAAAGRLKQSSSSSIAGSAVLAAGQFDLLGSIQGKTHLAGGQADLSGNFNQTVTGAVGSATIGSAAVIAGDLQLMTEEEAQISNGATITGRRDVRVIERHQEEERQDLRPDWGMLVFNILGGMFAGAVLLSLFSKQAQTTSGYMLKKPLETLVWGFVKLVVTPFVILLLLITVAGIPLAAVVFLLYIALFFVSGWLVSYALGRKIYQLTKANWLNSRYVQYLVGLIVLSLLTALPYLGGWVQFVMYLAGFGAVLQLENSIWQHNKVTKTHEKE